MESYTPSQVLEKATDLLLDVLLMGCLQDCLLTKVTFNLTLTEKTWANRFVTQRKEADQVEIISGVFEGKTTGTPICLLIKNEDQRSKDYGEIAKQFRPGHADYTYFKNTVLEIIGEEEDRLHMELQSGSLLGQWDILSKILGHYFKIKASVAQIGPHKIDAEKFDENQIDKNPFFCGDAITAKLWENYLDEVRKQGSSSGAVIEVVAKVFQLVLGNLCIVNLI